MLCARTTPWQGRPWHRQGRFEEGSRRRQGSRTECQGSSFMGGIVCRVGDADVKRRRAAEPAGVALVVDEEEHELQNDQEEGAL